MLSTAIIGNKFIIDYHYDKNGNQLTKVKSIIRNTDEQSLGIKTASELGENKQSEYFKYDVFNQLKEYSNTSGKKASYNYLPNGYRSSKTVNGTVTGFIWDGDNIAAETNSSGTVTNVLFRSNKLLKDSKGNIYVYDNHGSVTSLLDSNGNKTKTYEYNAFGKVEEPYLTETNPWQYCGEYMDQESGLIYLRNRYYDNETGRFINEDPIRSGLNWYSYCGGNPVMFWDPMGLNDVEVKYIAEKNSGTVISKQNILGLTKSVTVTIGDTVKTYNVGDGKKDFRIVEGRAVIDSSVLRSDFGLSYSDSIHLEGDLFNSEKDAVIAFGLTYYEKSLNEEQEYAAGIYQDSNGKWYFDNVTNSADAAGVNLEDLTREQRNMTFAPTDTNIIVHTHWEKWGNLEHSKTDNTNAMIQANKSGENFTSYVVNARGRIVYRTYYSNSITIGVPKSRVLANISRGV